MVVPYTPYTPYTPTLCLKPKALQLRVIAASGPTDVAWAIIQVLAAPTRDRLVKSHHSGEFSGNYTTQASYDIATVDWLMDATVIEAASLIAFAPATTLTIASGPVRAGSRPQEVETGAKSDPATRSPLEASGRRWAVPWTREYTFGPPRRSQGPRAAPGVAGLPGYSPNRRLISIRAATQ